MKKIYLLKLCLLASIFVSAQNWPTVNFYSTIYTRNGSAIQGFLYYPLSGTDYSDALSYTQSTYPSATILENPTSQYNCYSYAFHLSEGNTQKLWINPYTTSSAANLSKYWTDGSFIQVCNESDADVANYYIGGHAARTTAISGTYESKWGANCRVIHAYNYCPYDIGYYRREYYASTKIAGDIADLCTGSETFSVKSISGATYSWNCSSNLSITGATNTNSVSVQTSYSGNAWLQVVISTGCSGSSATSRLDFYAGVPNTPYVEEGGGQSICYDQFTDYYFVVNSPEANVTYKWGYIDPGNNTVMLTGYGSSTSPIIVFHQQASYRVFAIPYTPTCGEGDPGYFDLWVYPDWLPCDGRVFNLTVGPNPTKGALAISITDEKPEAKSLTKNENIEIYLYDFYSRTIVKKWLFKNDQTSFKLDASNVKKGQYVLQVKKGKYSQAKKVTIN